MRRVVAWGWIPFIVATVAAAGCGKSPTAPETVRQTATFNGKLTQAGKIEHPFTIPTQGIIAITVLSVARERPPLPTETPSGTDDPPGSEDGPPRGIPPHTDDPPAVEDVPARSIFIGVGIGTWTGSACSLVAQRTDASLSTVMTGTALAGEFCISVFDPGTVTVPIEYVVQVDYP